MYRDVFAQFNSDFGFLVDAVERGGLKTRGASELALARFHNRVAGAIHRACPGALVTVAAHSMPYTSDAPMRLEGWRPPARNLYSDAALVAAGGDADGTLDFYQVHSYPNWQDPRDEFNAQYMPFLNPKSRWRLDKPLLVGEFWDAVGGAGEGSLSAERWYGLLADGYAGGLGWAYFEVTEEFGGAAIVEGGGAGEQGRPGREPRRTVAKHQMRDRFAPLIREVARRLAEDRAAEVGAALVPPRGMSAAEFAALRGAGAAGAGVGASGAFAGGAGVVAGGGAASAGSEVPPPHSPPSSSSSRFASSDAIAKPRGAFKAASASGASKTKTASASTTSDAATSSDAAAAVVVPAAAAAAASSSSSPSSSAASPLLLSADVAAELAAAFSHAADAARTGGALSSSAAAPKVAAAAAPAAAAVTAADRKSVV